MEVVKIVFPSDPNILLDIQNLRQNDSHKIMRRLDSLRRHCEFSIVSSLREEDTKCLIDALVKSYLCCTDSIKISRAIEMLWQPLLPKYRNEIEFALEGHLMQMTREKLVSFQNVSRFSVLLEQNKTIQRIIDRNLLDVVSWISTELTPLLQKSPSSLSVSQCQCLYALIKIILQLFQVSPENLGDAIWNNTKPEIKALSPLKKAVKGILSSLLHILCHTGYQTDCVLLCGTATALLLNTLPGRLSAQCVFYSILQDTLHTDTSSPIDRVIFKAECTPIRIDLPRLSSLTENNIGTLSFIRGVVACGSLEILFNRFEDVESVSPDPPLAVTLFTYITLLCQGNITLHYHSFQILLLWYSRIAKATCWKENTTLANQIKSIIEQTLKIVLSNWDSPVEDVPTTVVNICDHMMSFWSMMEDRMSDLPQHVLKTLLSAAWFVKGKYRILAVVLKYLDHRKVLEEFPDIRSQLLQCLTTNHLSSTATNVYKAFLTQSQKVPKEDVNAAWQTLWMDTVIEGLASSNSLLQYNTSTYWIPVSLKLVPSSGVILQHKLTQQMENAGSHICYTRLLHAWTVVSKAIRLVTGKVDLSNMHVREALHSLDEGVRSDVISMICTTLKKSEPLSMTEISLLKEVLVYNIKIDSAPFRQHLASGLRNVLARIRDSCIPLLKSQDRNAEVLGRCVDFVAWLHRHCMDCLLPGSSYQRRKGSLDLLVVIYDCLIYRPDDKQRKGFTPDSAVHLVEHACKEGKWEFFNKENMDVLVMCLLDGASEIQTGAFNLLTRYYDFASIDSDEALISTCCHLVKESLSLCNSPKGHESDSGSILCKLVFQKCMLSQSMCCTFTFDEDHMEYTVVSSGRESTDRMAFIHSLLGEAKRQFKLSNENLVKASKQYTIHGLIMAITSCVTETPDLLQSISETDAVNILAELIMLCIEVIDKMLNIMATVAGQEACPSFAEIGLALEALLHENESEYTESTAQSPEFQFMLAWCWNNINVSCSCLGDVTLAVVQSGLPLTFSMIEKISTTYMGVLTKCRHKGVLEGCRSAFVKFCSALFASNQEEFYRLPAAILSQVIVIKEFEVSDSFEFFRQRIGIYKVLTSLKNNVMSSSVTRRSAGLPIIVQAILVSEKKIKKTVLLKRSVLALFEIAQLPLKTDSGQTDLPQVHGLNILNSLFGDASLSGNLTGDISQAVIMVIKEFGSPSWGVRNAATRFFSTLIKRIFGQKKTSDMTLCNTVTFQEFSAYYPELPPFLLKVLTEASNRDICDISQIHPGLFPVLTLLSCLNPTDTMSEALKRELQVFQEKTQPFLGSPVYQLRHLVASALVTMVNMADMIGYMEEVLVQCQSGTPCNQLHGNLLFVLQLVQHITRSDDLKQVQCLILNSHHMLNCVPIVSSTYAKLLTRLVKKTCDIQLPDDLVTKLEKCCCAEENYDIGISIYMEQSVNFLFLCNQSTNSQMTSLVQKLLSSRNQDTRKACLDYLESMVNEASQKVVSWTDPVLKTLCSSLKFETNVPNMCTMLNMISTLFLNNPLLERHSVVELEDWLQTNSPLIKQYVSLNAASLPVCGIVIQHNIRIKNSLDNMDVVCEYCDDLLKNVTVTNETQRLSVTQALLIAGQPILSLILDKQCESLSSPVVSLLGCCFILVQDEDTEIRDEACKFISHLKFETDVSLYKYESLHSNICYERLLAYTIKQFHFSTKCVQFLINQLYTEGQLIKVIEEKKTLRFHQLFEQEDNSFFAEKIYNAFCIHKLLKESLKHTQDDPIYTCLEISRQAVSTDVERLMEILQTWDTGCVINDCSDTEILASVCSVLLMCDLINHTDLKEHLAAVIQMNILPLNMKRQLLILMAE